MSKGFAKKKAAKDLMAVESSPTQKTIQKHGLSGIVVIGKTDGQKKALETIRNFDISILSGMAGTGKTWMATGMGIQYLLQGKYEKLILTRPYVEAGEHLGYLPGSFNSKIAPFMYPIMDIASQFIGLQAVTTFVEQGNIQVMPLAYLRGVTFMNSYVILDESQNCTCQQMRMFLTRLGEGSKAVITGDTEQSDLHSRNGLTDAVKRLKEVKEIGFAELGEADCVRSPIVSKIDKLYREKD